jgi:hypothetical protein
VNWIKRLKMFGNIAWEKGPKGEKERTKRMEEIT